METELKLQVAEPGCWQQLLAHLPSLAPEGAVRRGRFRAIYYDTPGGALRQARLALRVRQEDGRWMATLKGGGTGLGGLHQRQEWNVPLKGPQEPSLYLFAQTGAAEVLRAALAEEEEGLTWQAVLETDFERTSLEVSRPDGSRVEIAADAGAIIAGGQRSPILELELELLAGGEAALFALGGDLARLFPLLPGSSSKYHRGLQLAGLAAPEEEPPGGCVAGSREVLLHWLKAAAYWQGRFLAQPEEVQPVHQLRVYLRRLRSALSFCRPFLTAEDCRKHQQELRLWAGRLAGVRETDVLLASLAASGLGAEEGLQGGLELELTARRRVLAADAWRELSQGGSTPLLLSLWGWLLSADWGQEPTPAQLTARLAKWVEKLRQVGEEADAHHEEQLHAWRIQGKKVRYALELCLLQRLRLSPELVEALADLQDALGELHDIQVQHKLLLQWRETPALAWEAGLLAGWQESERRRLLPALPGLRKEFRRYARRWLREYTP